MYSILVTISCGIEKNVCSTIVSFKNSNNKFNNAGICNIIYIVNILKFYQKKAQPKPKKTIISVFSKTKFSEYSGIALDFYNSL